MAHGTAVAHCRTGGERECAPKARPPGRGERGRSPRFPAHRRGQREQPGTIRSPQRDYPERLGRHAARRRGRTHRTDAQLQRRRRPRPPSRRRNGRRRKSRAPPRLRGDDRHTPHHHPEELAALAGANEIVEYSHQYKIDLNQARALSTGTAYFISRRHATKARVIQAPQPATSALPSAPGAGGSDHDRARVGTASRTHAPY